MDSLAPQAFSFLTTLPPLPHRAALGGAEAAIAWDEAQQQVVISVPPRAKGAIEQLFRDVPPPNGTAYPWTIRALSLP